MSLINSIEQNLRDFEERKEPDLSNVYNFKGYEYVAVHPMSDEQQILDELGMQPTDCIKVDLYWRVENLVFFLQINSIKFTNNGKIGLFARWETKNSRVYLEANLEVLSISKSVVEIVMDNFLSNGLLTKDFSDETKFRQNVYLGDAPRL